MTALADRAGAEGVLTTIGLRRDSCNSGGIVDTFKAKFGLRVDELDPNASPADQLAALKTGSTDHVPDVINVDLALAASAKADDLLAPYKVATWDTVPNAAKDPDGAWYGGYYGVIAFEVNANAVTVLPEDWPDLLNSRYEGGVALAGDPRTTDLGVMAVIAAGLANGGSLDNAGPGLDFFKQLHDAGNLTSTLATTATITAGDTPIAIRWTYDALADRDRLAAAGGPTIEVVVPKNGRLAAAFVEGIAAAAPHPEAAKLWMEYLYSDEAQSLRIKGRCHPIRWPDLVARDVVPVEDLAVVPDVVGAAFPSLEQLDEATAVIESQWDEVVGASGD
jgi:putative spermidine/putrescine transport system substrate-binding protein